MLEGQPDPPRYFAMMKRLNREGPALLGHLPAPSHISAPSLEQAIAAGAMVLDLRSADVAANRFIPGTLNLPFNKAFVVWAGWLAGYDRDIYLLTDSADDAPARAAAAELAMIGLDRVAGWFGADAFTCWEAAGRHFDAIPQVDATTLERWLEGGSATLVDVRAASEWDVGHIAGARLAPLGRLVEALPSLGDARHLVMQCQSGSRSAIAASLATLHGIPNVVNLRGGILGWQDARLPLEREPVAVSV